MKRTSNGRGFTVVELVVVVVVLAVAGIIITPAISLARETASNSMCKSRLNSWGSAYSQYLSEHNDRFHKGDTVASKSCSDVWMMALRPYISDPKMMFCPESSGTEQEGGVVPTMAWQLKNDQYYLPIKQAGLHQGSYCLNWWVNDADVSNGSTGYYWRTAQSNDANNIPVLADGGDYTAIVYDDGKDYYPSSVPIDSEMPVRLFKGKNNINKYLVKRHGDSSNVLFMDSSVRSVKLTELWSLNWHKGYRTVSAKEVSWQWPDWLK